MGLACKLSLRPLASTAILSPGEIGAGLSSERANIIYVLGDRFIQHLGPSRTHAPPEIIFVTAYYVNIANIYIDNIDKLA